MDTLALVAGELTAYLTVNNDDFRRGVSQAKGDINSLAAEAKRSGDSVGASTERMAKSVGEGVTRLTRDAQGKLRNSSGQFATDAQKIAAGIGVEMGKGGEKSGGLLAQGMRSGFVRNSPLIVAGVAAALTAGAPLMVAAAGTMFGGIGAIAAAQTVQVRSAFSTMGKGIRDGAVSDAAVLVPTYVNMARDIGSAFERMRPQLREAFADSRPLIDSFTDGVIALGENAMPGLVRSVAAAGPVFEGLESFLGSVGTGISGFFDAINGHGPAAGQVFASLGDILGDLLPILGELMGAGTELASAALPALSAALGVVADVAGVLSPVLGPLAIGFAAFKIASAVAPGIATLGTTLGVLAAAGGKAGPAMEVTGRGLHAVSTALPGIGVALGVIASVMGRVNEQSDQWANALLEGGRAAETARAQMSTFGGAMEATNSGFEGFIVNLLGMGTPLATAGMALDEAKEKTREMIAAMDPASRTKALLTQATNDLSAALEGEGRFAGDVAAAQANYDQALANSEAAAADLEMAIDGVTSAMVDQANQALAAIDSGFNYRNSVDQLEDAQAKLAETIVNRTNADENLRTTEEDVQRAMLGVEEQAYRTALAYGQQQADLSGLEEGTKGYDRFVQESMLQSLQQMRQSAGPEMAAAIDQQIRALQAGGVAVSQNTSLVNTLTGQVQGLTGQIHAVPGQKYVQIDAPTAPQIAQLQALGYTVTHLPNGSIYVSLPNAGGVEGSLNYLARPRTMTIRVNTYAGTSYNTGGIATGGKVGDVPMSRAKGFALGGKLSGPGTTVSDSIGPFAVPKGQVFLSNQEWIINAMAAARQGDAKMSALNAGMADIVMRGDRRVRGLSGGGRVSQMNPATGTGTSTPNGSNVYNVTLNSYGVDFSRAQDRHRLIGEIKQGLIESERASS